MFPASRRVNTLSLPVRRRQLFRSSYRTLSTYISKSTYFSASQGLQTAHISATQADGALVEVRKLQATDATHLLRLDDRRRFFADLSSSDVRGVEDAVENDEEQDSTPLESHLNQLVGSGTVQPDEFQVMAARELDRILSDLRDVAPDSSDESAMSEPTSSQKRASRSKGLFSSIASWFANVPIPFVGTSTIHGTYLHGGVGCGKTFLMTLFHDHVPDGIPKVKVHFHKFMLDVHQHLHEARQERQAAAPSTKLNGRHPAPLVRMKQHRHGSDSGDLIIDVVDRIVPKDLPRSNTPWVLCLDEFQVTDVADAMLLRQLFDGLWKRGCVLVATSNRPPEELYKDGLQRDRFLPFLDALADNCAIVNMTESPVDYRLLALSSDDGHIRVVFSKSELGDLNRLFHQLVGKGNPIHPVILKHKHGNRTLRIPQACPTKHIARFAFADLCQSALGAADYIILAQNFATVTVDTIPKLQVHIHLNYIRRFITFIDAMYDANVTVLLQTTVQNDPNAGDLSSLLDQILDVTTTTADDEVFALERCKSRLMEMSSSKYLQKQWKGKAESTGHVGSTLNLHPSSSDEKGKRE